MWLIFLVKLIPTNVQWGLDRSIRFENNIHLINDVKRHVPFQYSFSFANLLGRVTRQTLYGYWGGGAVEYLAISSLTHLPTRNSSGCFLVDFLRTIRTTVERKRINRSVFVRNFSWRSFGFNSTSRFDGSVLNYSLRWSLFTLIMTTHEFCIVNAVNTPLILDFLT